MDNKDWVTIELDQEFKDSNLKMKKMNNQKLIASSDYIVVDSV